MSFDLAHSDDLMTGFAVCVAMCLCFTVCVAAPPMFPSRSHPSQIHNSPAATQSPKPVSSKLAGFTEGLW